MATQAKRARVVAAVTETPNELTTQLGEGSGLDVVRLLRQVDSQMFAGWREYAGLFDDSILETLGKVAEASAEMLTDPNNNTIILSGCGTSGRVAFFVARAFNLVMAQSGQAQCFQYIIAGQDPALFTSREAPEDSWKSGHETLLKAVEGKKRALFIGITCGFSAPFVASQLEYCMDHTDTITSVLLGFNPVERARTTVIEGWTKTFADVVARMQASKQGNIAHTNPPAFSLSLEALALAAEGKKCHILNPIVGPEALTGSTRMKGGSATKIILEVVIALGLKLQQQKAGQASTVVVEVAAMLGEYERTVRSTYFSAATIANLVELAGASLKAGGHVYYLGRAAFGVAGLVDASECPPTYNATHEDVRDLTYLGDELLLTWEDFDQIKQPNLTANDLVIFLEGTIESDTAHLDAIKTRATAARASGSKVACITVHEDGAESSAGGAAGTFAGVAWDAHVAVVLPAVRLEALVVKGLPQGEGCLLAELAMKLVLNSVTTGGHVLAGKIMRDDIAAEVLALDVSEHIVAATNAVAANVRVIPTAILLASRSELKFAAAQAVLASHPQLAAALKNV
eukprot:gene753-4495_t